MRYNHAMQKIYIVQLIGVLITGAGVLALTASTYLYGTPLTREEKRRAGHNGPRGRASYRLPFNFESIASALFLLGGLGILTWSKFELCPFLSYWLPDLPEALRFLVTCR